MKVDDNGLIRKNKNPLLKERIRYVLQARRSRAFAAGKKSYSNCLRGANVLLD